MRSNCVTHEIMSSDSNKRIPAVPPELQGGVNSVEEERHRTAESSERDISPVAVVENCRGPQPAEVNVRPGKSFPGPNMSPGEGFPGPVAKALKMSGSFIISPDPGQGRPGPGSKSLTRSSISDW